MTCWRRVLSCALLLLASGGCSDSSFADHEAGLTLDGPARDAALTADQLGPTATSLGRRLTGGSIRGPGQRPTRGPDRRPIRGSRPTPGPSA